VEVQLRSINLINLIERSTERMPVSMLNLNSIMVGTQRLEDLAAFYAQVIGRQADMVDDEQGFRGWQVGSSCFSVLGHSAIQGASKDPGRLIFNFETTQVKEGFARIKALGAQVIHEPYAIGEGWIATLADPDGNYFQPITPMG
jgi:predicted enzyme related to lactoylglutathione lyase